MCQFWQRPRVPDDWSLPPVLLSKVEGQNLGPSSSSNLLSRGVIRKIKVASKLARSILQPLWNRIDLECEKKYFPKITWPQSPRAHFGFSSWDLGYVAARFSRFLRAIFSFSKIRKCRNFQPLPFPRTKISALKSSKFSNTILGGGEIFATSEFVISEISTLWRVPSHVTGELQGGWKFSSKNIKYTRHELSINYNL